MGYLEQLRERARSGAEPGHAGADRAVASCRPGGIDGDTPLSPPEPPGSEAPAGRCEAAPDADRCAAPGCRAPIDAFGPDGVGRCARHAPPDTVRPVPPAPVVNERPYEENEENEESPPAEAGRQTSPYEENEENEESLPPAPCPCCARLQAQAAEVLAQLSTHPALPPALKTLPPERLAILVRWAIVSLSTPRPAGAAPRPTAAGRAHRRPLDALIADLGGRPAGAEAAAPGISVSVSVEDDDVEDDDG